MGKKKEEWKKNTKIKKKKKISMSASRIYDPLTNKESR
jgi:hypothetical protein